MGSLLIRAAEMKVGKYLFFKASPPPVISIESFYHQLGIEGMSLTSKPPAEFLGKVGSKNY